MTSSGAFDRAAMEAWLRGFATVVGEQREHLTALDSAIGDADHGANMARGTAAVVERLESTDPDEPIGAVAKAAGMALVSKVGGASGPLYGTFFLRFGGAVEDDELDARGLLAALEAGVDGVVARGRAELGDKTMVDALRPATEAIAAAVEDGADLGGALRAGAEAAASGRDATEPMIARKGRASYLGERSRGHVDPGATSSALLLATLADAVTDDA